MVFLGGRGGEIDMSLPYVFFSAVGGGLRLLDGHLLEAESEGGR